MKHYGMAKSLSAKSLSEDNLKGKVAPTKTIMVHLELCKSSLIGVEITFAVFTLSSSLFFRW